MADEHIQTLGLFRHARAFITAHLRGPHLGMSTIVMNRKYFTSSSAERLGHRCHQLAILLFIRSPIILIITLEQVT